MVKFCPECGVKLDSEYKFCPECGFDLSKIPEQKSGGGSNSDFKSSNKNVEVIICDNCGEENDPSSDLCSSCGVKLAGHKEIREYSSLSDDVKLKTTINKTGKKNKKSAAGKKHSSKPAEKVSAEKKLNTAKFITISAIGLGIAFVILLFSGILNTVVIPDSGNNVSQQSSSSGVDLSNLQKINSLENQVKSNPADTAAILELAHLKNDAGMYQQAIANYKQYLALVPKDPDARIDMGVCYYNLQDYNTAAKEMELAIKYDPKHQIGYLNLGIVNLTAGKMEKAREWLRKAVQLDPKSEYGKKAEELLKSHVNTNQMNGGK